jgi:hypothetical protein
MDSGIFDEYLVRVGFDSDPAGYAKFKATLADASATVSHHTYKIVKDIVGIQSAIVGGFAAIDGGILSFAEHVADADLGFQLYATRMYMTVGAAKSLKVATDALGNSLDEIAWNPELLHRFEALEVLQSTLSKQMDPGFEKNMQGIRDLGFEMTKLRVEGEYIASNVVSQLFKGLDGEGALKKLEDVNSWITSHLPEITQFFTQHLIPIFKDGEAAIGGTVSVMKDLALTFTNLVGAFSFDTSIEGSTFSMERFATAIDKVANGLAGLVGWISSAEKSVLDIGNRMVHLAMFRSDLVKGDSDKLSEDASLGGLATVATVGLVGSGVFKVGHFAAHSVKYFGRILNRLATGSAGSAEVAEAGASAGESGLMVAMEVMAGLLSDVFVPAFIGTIIGAGVTAWDKSKYATHFRRSLGLSEIPAENRHRIWQLLTGHKLDPIGTGKYATESATPAGDIHALIDSLALGFGVDRSLAHAVAMTESGEQQYKNGRLYTSDKGAQGVFQLEPGTASQYGVDASDVAGNIKGGLHLLSDLGKKYNGNLEEVLAAYNWGSGNLDKAIARHGGFDTSYLPKETRDYIASIESRMASGSIHITNQIYASPHANPQEIGRQVSDQTVAQMRAFARRKNTTTTAMLGSSYQ